MSSDTTQDKDELDVAEETIEDLDADDADVQGGMNITLDQRIRKVLAPRPTVPPN